MCTWFFHLLVFFARVCFFLIWNEYDLVCQFVCVCVCHKCFVSLQSTQTQTLCSTSALAICYKKIIFTIIINFFLFFSVMPSSFPWNPTPYPRIQILQLNPWIDKYRSDNNNGKTMDKYLNCNLFGLIRFISSRSIQTWQCKWVFFSLLLLLLLVLVLLLLLNDLCERDVWNRNIEHC